MDILALIVCSLMPEDPHLADSERNKVESDVVQFVNNQITSLPAYLRIPFKILISIFNCFAIFVCGNVFYNLNKKSQIDYLNLWTNSGLKPMRDFIKLMRSCTLLQYYDHPLVFSKINMNEKETYDRQLQPRKN